MTAKKLLRSLLLLSLSSSLSACGGIVSESRKSNECADMPKITDNELEILDFNIDVPAGRDIKILQLTDIQTINLNGIGETPNNTRYAQVSGAFFSDEASHDDYIRAWKYIEVPH